MVRKRELDPDYVRWIHAWDCVVPGCTKPSPVHAHHVVSRARLGSDRTCIPLCPVHHLKWVHHKGHLTSQRAWGIDFNELVKEFNQKYEAGKKGPHQYLLHQFESFRAF